MPRTPAAPGTNLLPFWFEQGRAREIIADVIATNAACLERRDIQVRATWANQVEQGVEFSGPLVDELAAMQEAAEEEALAATDWSDDVSTGRYRAHRAGVTDLLLAALDWRPNGGGSHGSEIEAFFRPRADARSVAA